MEYIILLGLTTLFALFCASCAQQGEMLLNADFEQPFSGEGWEGSACDITQNTDSYTGVYSCKVSNV